MASTSSSHQLMPNDLVSFHIVSPLQNIWLSHQHDVAFAYIFAHFADYVFIQVDWWNAWFTHTAPRRLVSGVSSTWFVLASFCPFIHSFWLINSTDISSKYFWFIGRILTVILRWLCPPLFLLYHWGLLVDSNSRFYLDISINIPSKWFGFFGKVLTTYFE